MTIYLAQGGEDGARADEIEDKLRSTIPDLKRVRTVEDIDRGSDDSEKRSIVVLVPAAAKDTNVDNLIEVVRRYPRSIFFIIVGGDIFPGL
jgi:hypothetical protein